MCIVGRRAPNSAGIITAAAKLPAARFKDRFLEEIFYFINSPSFKDRNDKSAPSCKRKRRCQ
jgi:hypothetical protein